MYLSNSDKERVLQSFPPFKLSYEKHHKKIYPADIFLTIPKGQKYFAWFRHYRKKNICFFLRSGKNYNIMDITIKSCCFNSELCSQKGTILYGTIFIHNNISFFNIENIYYFKNINVDVYNQRKKIKLFSLLFKKYIKQLSLSKNHILFGLPLMDTNYSNFIKQVHSIPYNIYCIQHRYLDKNTYFINEFITRIQYKIFTIKPKIQDDIYELYEKINETLKYFDIAYIPDYKTSVFMNSLFRNIKENDNLDALEESDDEDEFENTKIDKYVYLDKKLEIKCVYLQKFNKWKPIEVIS